MKSALSFVLIIICVLGISGCGHKTEAPASFDASITNPSADLHVQVPYDAALNLEVGNGKFVFQRIATTPCIVYSNIPISEMSEGTVYDDRYDILTAIFKATDGKDTIADTSECEFSHYIYMFDKEHEDVPWHYRFAICNCGTVLITNNDEVLCAIKISEEEMQSIWNAFRE